MKRAQDMKNVKFYLNQLANHTETGSDYAIAKLLGISRARISGYRTGKSLFDDEMCMKVAEVLGLDPLEVIAAMNAIRAKSQAQKSFWEKTYARITGTAAAVTLALALSLGSSVPSPTYAAENLDNNTYYAKLRRRLRTLLSAFLLFFGLSHALAGEWVREIGFAMHATALDAPEISLENPLFVLEIGYRFDTCLPGVLEKCTVKIEHHSSIGTSEVGYGYNVIKLTTSF